MGTVPRSDHEAQDGEFCQRANSVSGKVVDRLAREAVVSVYNEPPCVCKLTGRMKRMRVGSQAIRLPILPDVLPLFLVQFLVYFIRSYSHQ